MTTEPQQIADMFKALAAAESILQAFDEETIADKTLSDDERKARFAMIAEKRKDLADNRKAVTLVADLIRPILALKPALDLLLQSGQRATPPAPETGNPDNS